MCTSKIIGSIGLVFDIVGAIFVAYEVVNVYRGSITGTINGTWNGLGEPTTEYKEFESKKHKHMKIGLAFLIIGFILQIIALWIK